MTLTTTYTASFDRVGISHKVAPLSIAVPNHLLDNGTGADFIAESVYRYVRPKLLSRDIEVQVDLDNGQGHILCGMRNGGTFSVKSTEGCP